MKLFLVACLAVAVSADPGLLINPLTYNLGVNPLGVHPLGVNPLIQPVTYVRPAEEKKIEKDEKGATKTAMSYAHQPILPYTTYPFINTHLIAKREAEADPLWLTQYAGMPLGYSAGVYPYAGVYRNVLGTKVDTVNPFTGTSLQTVSNDRLVNRNYAGRNQVFRASPSVDGRGAVHIAKREAEADPLFINPYTYSSMAYPSIYSTSLVNPVVNPVVNPLVRTVVTPVVRTVPAAPIGEGVLSGRTYANDASQPTPFYAGKGLYRSENEGATHIAKREAEPFFYRNVLPTTYTAGLTGYPYTTTYPYTSTYPYRSLYSGVYY